MLKMHYFSINNPSLEEMAFLILYVKLFIIYKQGIWNIGFTWNNGMADVERCQESQCPHTGVVTRNESAKSFSKGLVYVHNGLLKVQCPELYTEKRHMRSRAGVMACGICKNQWKTWSKLLCTQTSICSENWWSSCLWV